MVKEASVPTMVAEVGVKLCNGVFIMAWASACHGHDGGKLAIDSGFVRFAERLPSW